MTTLQTVLDNRFNQIAEKEDLIRQLQDEIAQARKWTQAAEGVSSTLDNAKELFFNAMASFYSLMQHEPDEVRTEAREKIWQEFKHLDVQAQQHIDVQKSLGFDEVSEPESDEESSDIQAESDTHTIEVVVEPLQPKTVVEKPVEQLSQPSSPRVLDAAELKKDKVDWTTLKALAKAMGVTSKKRLEIEVELLKMGVTDKELEAAVQLEF